MKEYMMIFRQETSDKQQMPSNEQMQAMMGQWKTWISDIAKNGKYVGTNRLLPEGKTLKPNNVTTDGPYLEAKELIGGYLIVKANNIDEAVAMAKSCPHLLYGGHVEVRAVMAIVADPTAASFLSPQ